MRPHGSAERGPPTWHRPLDKGPVIGTALDQRVNHTGHLGGDRGQRLAPPIGIVPVPGDVALELVAEAVLPLANSDVSGHPQRSSQAGVTILRELGMAAEGA